MTRCQLRITVGGQNESCLEVQKPHHGTVIEIYIVTFTESINVYGANIKFV